MTAYGGPPWIRLQATSPTPSAWVIITRVPTGYALSLWVMTASGPEDVPIGRFATLIEASNLSGQLEDFVQRANVKQHRHA